MRNVAHLLLALALTAPAGRAAAQVIDAGAALLVFPLIVVDAEHDTLIRVANRSTRVSYARCEYTPAGAGGAATDFELVLRSRQPTQWLASRGRPIDPNDPHCSADNGDCGGAGFDPGAIPPLPEGFRGDLLCVQVDRSRAPTSGNALRGSAALLDAAGDLAAYEAVGLRGLARNDGDDALCLGGGGSEACPAGAEYAACPSSWLIGLRADGTPAGAGEAAPAVRNRLAVSACSRRSGGDAAQLMLLVTNEFEQRFSASAGVQRTGEIVLADYEVLRRDVAGSDFLQMRVRPSAATGTGVVVVALSDRAAADGAAAGGADAVVPYPEGAHERTDRILLGEE